MNGTIKPLFAALSVTALTSVAQAEVTTYKATTDDRHNIEGHGYSKSGDTETFIIAAADRKKGQRLTPRVEREFERKALIRSDIIMTRAWPRSMSPRPPSSWTPRRKWQRPLRKRDDFASKRKMEPNLKS